MPEPLSRSEYSTTADGHLVIEGGSYPSYANGPGPTEWVSSNRIYSLDLNNFEGGELENTSQPENRGAS